MTWTELLLTASKKLNDENFTCVAMSDNREYTSNDRGIFPIYSPMRDDIYFFKEMCVADKVIGKAAAMLLVISKASHIHANVISEHAMRVFVENDTSFTYDKKVDYIVNRKGDGMCPMEESVIEISDLEEAYNCLKNKMEQMK